MENHGTVVGGINLVDAFQRFETLELCARVILFGNMVGKPTYLSDDDIEKFDQQIPEVLQEMEEVTHPADEREKRSEICSIVQRA